MEHPINAMYLAAEGLLDGMWLSEVFKSGINEDGVGDLEALNSECDSFIMGWHESQMELEILLGDYSYFLSSQYEDLIEFGDNKYTCYHELVLYLSKMRMTFLAEWTGEDMKYLVPPFNCISRPEELSRAIINKSISEYSLSKIVEYRLTDDSGESHVVEYDFFDRQYHSPYLKKERDEALLHFKDEVELFENESYGLKNFNDTNGIKDRPEQNNETCSIPSSKVQKTDYLFVNKGQFYEIAGFGQSGNVKATKGIKQIAKLLSTPCNPVTFRELYQIDFDNNSSGVKKVSLEEKIEGILTETKYQHQNAMTQEDIKEFKDWLEEANIEIAQAENTNPEQVESLKKDFHKVSGYLQDSITPSGTPKNIDPQPQRERSSVTDALRVAYKNMKSAGLDKIEEHFKESIKTEQGKKIYNPTEKINWIFS